MKCRMVEQGYEQGSCLVQLPDGTSESACEATLRGEPSGYSRLIEAAHLSRPEHYFSIYQSGCNHSCLQCHSSEFSQHSTGRWCSAEEIAGAVREYESNITCWEPRERATMWHATDLCRSCGQCLVKGVRSSFCPGVLEPGQVRLSPQGFGPARNICAFTGGDLSCNAQFYAQVTELIKERCENMWVLLETNGYGLTPDNLDTLAESGLDSVWLDIKAYDEDTYRRLCGTTNEWILKAPGEIKKRGMVLEVLTLFIPEWVESDQIERIAEMVCEVDEETPFTILAFFPSHLLPDNPPPTLAQMLEAYFTVQQVGLKNVKLGNLSVFVKTQEDLEKLIEAVGLPSIG